MNITQAEHDAANTVLIDEAALILRMFGYLTRREGLPKGKPRDILEQVEERIDKERDVHDKMALVVATDLTKLAMLFITDTINEQRAAAGLGEGARKVSLEEAQQ